MQVRQLFFWQQNELLVAVRTAMIPQNRGVVDDFAADFGEFRPFVTLCQFPDCTHTHETGCGVKAGVARRLISDRRYHSYIGMVRGEEE